MNRIVAIKCPKCEFEQKMFKSSDKTVISFQCERCMEEFWCKEKRDIYEEFGI